MKRLFIFLSALFALFLLQVAPAQAISLGSKTASAKGPDTLLIIQLDPNYVGKPGEIEKRIFDSFADRYILPDKDRILQSLWHFLPQHSDNAMVHNSL